MQERIRPRDAMGRNTAWRLIAGRVQVEGRARAAFEAIPVSVLTAVIAPTLLGSSVADTLAGVATVVAAFRLPLLGTVIVGVIAVALLRLAIG